LQLEYWLVREQLRAAVRWADEVLERDAAKEVADDKTTELALGRVLIVKGDVPALDRAIELLKHLVEVAEAEGRMGGHYRGAGASGAGLLAARRPGRRPHRT
jgi:hypothetical protein